MKLPDSYVITAPIPKGYEVKNTHLGVNYKGEGQFLIHVQKVKISKKFLKAYKMK